MKKSNGSSNESSLPKVQLRVAEAKHRDIGKGRTRIDPVYLRILGIEAGEVIELIGKRNTAATAWPSDEEEKETDIIRMDGQIRKNAGVGLNDLVIVRRIDAKTARTAVLMPLVNSTINVDKEFCEFVKNRLRGFPVNEGDEISVVILGNPINFRIERVSPRSIVKIELSTKLHILSEIVVDKKPRVTYEEIGGLKEQIKRLREIVELPLRHP
ncbi:MAG TPA: AAA family ATPase, partial [Nitrososphaeraceae archaeon]|nr:AAA family ATPase [Nitrososphaeraceae archaeon]